jgi:hypothetical protein
VVVALLDDQTQSDLQNDKTAASLPTVNISLSGEDSVSTIGDIDCRQCSIYV